MTVVASSLRLFGSTRSRGKFGIAVGLAHALAIALVWHAEGARREPVGPRVIDVAIVASPPPVKPPPVEPPRERRVRVPLKQAPLPPPSIDAPTSEALPALAVAEPLREVALARPAPLVIAIASAPELGPAPLAAAPEPHVTSPRFDAAYLDNPAPLYPPDAKRMREQGRVLLRVLVTATGRAERVEIARTSGVESLDRAAVDAVRRWRFVPAQSGNAPVAAFVNVPIVFSLAS